MLGIESGNLVSLKVLQLICQCSETITKVIDSISSSSSQVLDLVIQKSQLSIVISLDSGLMLVLHFL